jgi:hypothetical protein
MKTRKLSLVIALVFVSSLVFGQDYAFKVMANKGSNEVKSGDSWQPLKTGASLKSSDEVKLVDNAYLGLISAQGKPLEVRQAGNYKVADLTKKISAGSTVVNKYTDFILSSNAETKKNKLGATGAVERGDKHAITLMLPSEKNSAVLNNVAIINFTTEANGPYIVTIFNMASEQLASFETPEKTFQIDLKDPKYKFNAPGDPFSAGMMVQVKSKSDPKLDSKEYMIKALPAKDAQQVSKSLETINAELVDQTALNKLILAGFYEENKLYIDAIAAYEEAIKLAPDVTSYKEAYDDFLVRNAIKK